MIQINKPRNNLYGELFTNYTGENLKILDSSACMMSQRVFLVNEIRVDNNETAKHCRRVNLLNRSILMVLHGSTLYEIFKTDEVTTYKKIENYGFIYSQSEDERYIVLSGRLKIMLEYAPDAAFNETFDFQLNIDNNKSNLELLSNIENILYDDN